MTKTLTRGGRRGRMAGRGNTEPRPSQEYTTYCIRLTDLERALLEKALKNKGWTPTKFIRQAALEKAAHVENVRGVTSFDFTRLARRLAQQLCEPVVRVVGLYEESLSFEDLKRAVPGINDDLTCSTEPPPLQHSDLDILGEAARLGGTEFFKKVLDECDLLIKRSDRPSPIDPEKLGQTENKE